MRSCNCATVASSRPDAAAGAASSSARMATRNMQHPRTWSRGSSIDKKGNKKGAEVIKRERLITSAPFLSSGGAGGALAVGFGQELLAQADFLRGDLDQLVVLDEI